MMARCLCISEESWSEPPPMLPQRMRFRAYDDQINKFSDCSYVDRFSSLLMLFVFSTLFDDTFAPHPSLRDAPKMKKSYGSCLFTRSLESALRQLR